VVEHLAAQQIKKDDAPPISSKMRAERLAKLDEQIFQLGLLEEAFIRWLRAHDTITARRDNADVFCVIGIAFGKQQLKMVA
jgi:hypothetical protein